MKFSIASYHCDFNNPDEKTLLIPKNIVEFDMEWFVNTYPSINDKHEFIPEWEDADNIDTVVLFFLAENAKTLIENNDPNLCDKAKLALIELGFEKSQIKD